MTEQISEEKDWGALAEKHLASIKRDMKISLEGATVRAAHKVMTEFNDTERESKVKQEMVKQQLDRLEADIAQLRVKTQELRNDVIGEVLQLIKELRPAIKPLEGMGKGKTTQEWFDILTETIKEKL
jgi:DNA-binding HxlR family transcriptional regulator